MINSSKTESQRLPTLHISKAFISDKPKELSNADNYLMGKSKQKRSLTKNYIGKTRLIDYPGSSNIILNEANYFLQTATPTSTKTLRLFPLTT